MFNPRSYENSRADGIGVLEVVGESPLPFVPLKRSVLHGVIAGPLADLYLTQTFSYTRTSCDRVLEAIYRFPLPGDAAVTGVTVHFGEVEIVAELKARQQAEVDYAAAKKSGQQAALATREAPDVFTLHVAGLQPDQAVVVETHYLQLARVEGADWTLRLPLTTPPRYVRGDERGGRPAQGQPLAVLRDPGHRFALDLRIQGVQQVTSPTHRLAVTSDEHAARVRLQAGDVLPDRDCVLVWTPVQVEGKPSLHIFTHVDNPTQQVYFLAQVTPPAHHRFGSGVAREVILLVDHSGSMTGPKWMATDWAVERFLGDLSERDRFALAAFHNHTQWFDPTLRHADTSTVSEAVAWLRQKTDSGGTELGVALEQAVNLPRTAGDYARHLLILTDAAVTDAARILRLADEERMHTLARRISVLCIDAAPNSFLALELAERGGGVARFLTSEPDQEDITTALDEVLADWAEPVFVGLRLSVNRAQVETSGRQILPPDHPDWSSIDLGDLPSGRALWIVGRAPLAATDQLTFQLQTAPNGHPSAPLATMAVDLLPAPALPALKSLFGARRVNGLEYLINAGYSGQQLAEQLTRLGYAGDAILGGQLHQPAKIYAENVRAEATKTVRDLLGKEAVAYQLASSETAFVAVRKEAGERVAGTIAVANALPTGWGGEFVTPASPKMATRAMAPQSLPMPASGVIGSIMNVMGTAKQSRASGAVSQANNYTASAPSASRGGHGVVFHGKVRSAATGTTLFDSTLFDSTATKDPLPLETTITGLSARLIDAEAGQQMPDRTLVLLLFVGDLAAPRAKIRLADLLQHGTRPVNLLRLAGQTVRILLQDPNGALTESLLQIEITLHWA